MNNNEGIKNHDAKQNVIVRDAIAMKLRAVKCLAIPEIRGEYCRHIETMNK